jgi:hypothetical protein
MSERTLWIHPPVVMQCPAALKMYQESNQIKQEALKLYDVANEILDYAASTLQWDDAISEMQKANLMRQKANQLWINADKILTQAAKLEKEEFNSDINTLSSSENEDSTILVTTFNGTSVISKQSRWTPQSLARFALTGRIVKSNCNEFYIGFNRGGIGFKLVIGDYHVNTCRILSEHLALAKIKDPNKPVGVTLIANTEKSKFDATYYCDNWLPWYEAHGLVFVSNGCNGCWIQKKNVPSNWIAVRHMPFEIIKTNRICDMHWIIHEIK